MTDFALLSEQTCEKILKLREGIRGIHVNDQQGRIILEKDAEVASYLSDDARENLREVWSAILQGVVGRLAEYWGEPQSLHIKFSKALVFGFPHDNGAVVVMAEPHVPLITIDEIQQILRDA